MSRFSTSCSHPPVVEQILWLEVSVNDSLLMHIGHGWQHLWQRQGHLHSLFRELKKKLEINQIRKAQKLLKLHLHLLDQVGGVFFWIRTLLHDSIKQLAPRHSLEKTRISFLQQNLLLFSSGKLLLQFFLSCSLLLYLSFVFSRESWSNFCIGIE